MGGGEGGGFRVSRLWDAPEFNQAQRNRKPFQSTSDGRLYRPYVDIRIGGRSRLRPPRWCRVQVDCGADCCVLAERIADDIGIAKPADAHEERLRTCAGLVIAWFAEVELHLGMPNDPYQFDWTAHVGFVRDEVLPVAFPAGILGIGGGLERFLSTVLIPSPDGPEATAVRIFTPPA